MAGEIKTLRQPTSSKRIGDVSPLEWFRCQWDNKPGIAMVVTRAGAVPLLKTDSMLFIGKDEGVRYLTIDVFHAYGGEFLGYLTTEDCVTIYGSLDPDWVEPTLDPTTLLPPETSDLSDVALSVPFEYRWTSCRDEPRYGIRYRSVDERCNSVILTVRERDGGHGYVMLPKDGGGRIFVRYAPEEAHRFENHPDRRLCVIP